MEPVAILAQVLLPPVVGVREELGTISENLFKWCVWSISFEFDISRYILYIDPTEPRFSKRCVKSGNFLGILFILPIDQYPF